MAISLPKKIIRPAAATSQAAAAGVKHHLGEIAKLFDRPKLTLVIRSSAIDGDIIVGNDDFDLAVKAIMEATREFGKQAIIPLGN
jgi:hypothetical protein